MSVCGCVCVCASVCCVSVCVTLVVAKRLCFVCARVCVHV